jgi:beta-lactamase regulating signal transducer with metallopeptidase domain
MNNYLIESSICLACFYSFYWLFLKSEKLLSLNRYYLLGTAILSMAIPLFNFESPLAIPDAMELFSSKTTTVEQGITSQADVARTQLISLASIYWIGVAVAFGLLLIKLFMVKQKVGKWPTLQNKHIDIIEIEGNDAYSFFNSIFIGKALNKNEPLRNQIIKHELAHIDGRHSIDLLIFELLKCVYWFNPFSYFYTKSIRIQHEYIADHYALKNSQPRSYEKSLVQFTLARVNSSLISSFREHPIQKRLKMIHKLNSNVMNKLKPLLALPILGVLFIAYACTDIAEPALVDEIQEVSEEKIFIEYVIKRPTILFQEADSVETTKMVTFYFLPTETEPGFSRRVKIHGSPSSIKTQMMEMNKDAIIEIPDDLNANGDEVRVNVEKSNKIIFETSPVTSKKVKRH